MVSKDRSASGVSATTGRAERITRSGGLDRSGWVWRCPGASESFPRWPWERSSGRFSAPLSLGKPPAFLRAAP